jgi:hypothetical protein
MTANRDAIALAEDVLGLELYPRQAEALAGIAAHPLSLLCLGRRSGKTLLACAWALYDAVVRDLSAHLRPGEPRYIAVVATSQDQARIAFRTIREFFDRPALAPLLVRESADELWLATNVCIKCLPCSARSTRGLAISTVILDEFAWFVDTEHGYQAGEQVYRALAPSVAQFGEAGRIIGLSTPRGQRGAFWSLWNSADPDTYRLQATTAAMNPRIDGAFLERERARDPELFAQEYQAEWLAGGAAFLAPAALQAAVGLPSHRHGMRVVALDPAFQRDSFAVAVVCEAADGEDQVHIEQVELWEPPISFAAALDAIAVLARTERADVVTDQFAAAPIVQGLAARGITCHVHHWTAENKADAYAHFKAGLNTGQIHLVDDARLLRGLATLEATPTAQGWRIEGPSDDVASAVVLGCWRLASRSRWRLL